MGSVTGKRAVTSPMAKMNRQMLPVSLVLESAFLTAGTAEEPPVFLVPEREPQREHHNVHEPDAVGSLERVANPAGAPSPAPPPISPNTVEGRDVRRLDDARRATRAARRARGTTPPE